MTLTFSQLFEGYIKYRTEHGPLWWSHEVRMYMHPDVAKEYEQLIRDCTHEEPLELDGSKLNFCAIPVVADPLCEPGHIYIVNKEVPSEVSTL